MIVSSTNVAWRPIETRLPQARPLLHLLRLVRDLNPRNKIRRSPDRFGPGYALRSPSECKLQTSLHHAHRT